jgi:site-specific recombinase XerD
VSALAQAAGEYLVLRRGAGFKLAGADQLLVEFADYIDAKGGRVTVELALEWATARAGSKRQVARRLSTVRLFVRYLQAVSPGHEVPPTGLVPFHRSRAIPHLYSEGDVEELMGAARQLDPELKALATEIAIGLLATTGMRIGEVLALDDADIDRGQAMLRIRLAKFDKERLVPLSPSTLSALGAYQARRAVLCPEPSTGALLVTQRGTRLAYHAFWRTFKELSSQVGLPAGARIHDLRHSFAVATLLEWYRRGFDVHALMPRLSVYLGHIDPAATYWYLSGSPELLALVAGRLEPVEATR